MVTRRWGGRAGARLGLVVAVLVAVALGGPGPAEAQAADLPAPTQVSPQSGAGVSGAPLAGVRTGRHDGYDRVVLDVTGPLPPWDVRYLPSPAGLPVRGEQVLRLRLEVDAAASTAPAVVTPELPTLRQVVRVAQAPMATEYALGLRDRVGFRVFALASPTRLVVDVAHQPGQPFGTAGVTLPGPHAALDVVGVRSGRHPGYDRVVLDLRGGAPRDLVVQYDGEQSTRLLLVLFAGFLPTDAPATYHGPDVVAVGLPAVRAVTHLPVHSGAGAPELIGISVDTAARHGFRVVVLPDAGSARVVLDVAH